uniref:BH2358 protein n=1 Tax=Halalkalibacterium halodurans (strain ATCC BAA-125 / DSM 18197 / FERM 7344 / JCM 9153 / C-125) TaxID=272558 RepID=UPI0001753F99
GMGILSGNPQDEPLHYGEVFSTWTYLSTNNGLINGYRSFINHTGDEDLKNLIDEAIQAMQDENHQLEELLRSNGVGLPPAPPDRPAARLDDIPVGARFNDPEISATISMDVAKGLVTCSQIIGQSIREDVALMFSQFHMAKVQFGGKMLKLNKNKGWLIPPPLHSDRPIKE